MYPSNIRIPARRRRPTPARVASGSTKTCFCCFYKAKRCDGLMRVCCSHCNPRGQGRIGIKNSPALHKSDVRACLDNLVLQCQPFTSQSDESISCTLNIALTTRHKLKDKLIELRQANRRIYIDQPFYPRSGALATEMDTFVQDYLSLKMKCTDNTSDLVDIASLAGGYLSWMFPMASPQKPPLAGMISAGDQPKRHLTKFCLFRFGDLSDQIIAALRTLDTIDNSSNRTLNIIAAAGVLYCEVEHVKQGLQSKTNELLWNDPDDPGLQRSLAAWLQSIGAELLARLRNTCTYITDWSQNLVRPLKRAKRNFDIQEMTVSIKVLPQPQDSSSHSRTTDRSNICPGDHSPASAGGSVAMSRTETILSSLDLQTFTADDDYGYQSLPSILDVTEMAAGDASDMHYRDISLYSPYGSPWTNQTIRLQAPNYLLPGDGSNSEIEVFHNMPSPPDTSPMADHTLLGRKLSGPSDKKYKPLPFRKIAIKPSLGKHPRHDSIDPDPPPIPQTEYHLPSPLESSNWTTDSSGEQLCALPTPQFYNAATGEAGTIAMLDSRNQFPEEDYSSANWFRASNDQTLVLY